MAVKLIDPAGVEVETSETNAERLLQFGYTKVVDTTVVIETPKRRGRPPKNTEE